MKTTTDRIEKQISLNVPRARVWRALADAQEFGQWFGVKLEGTFAPGARVRGKVLHKGYEHVPFEMTIERMEPERLFSYRWHPYAVEPGVDYSKEPTTLVEFTLEQKGSGTSLTVSESGFDGIPLARRAKAFEMNEQGWGQQVESIKRHVGATA
jgi:uncharacterized protein YndB with AHSA1/START domain